MAGGGWQALGPWLDTHGGPDCACTWGRVGLGWEPGGAALPRDDPCSPGVATPALLSLTTHCPSICRVLMLSISVNYLHDGCKPPALCNSFCSFGSHFCLHVCHLEGLL